jgi:hypothetical protein
VRGGIRGNLFIAGLALVVGAGCLRFEPSAEARARLARTLAEGAELEAAVEVLEERLLVGQSNVRLWQELGERHGRVSEVACANLTGHVEAMARHQARQKEKAQLLARRSERARVAPAVEAQGGPVSP